MSQFKIKVEYKPQGDQPKSIDRLAKNIISGRNAQTLLGVTGSGKTFTIANMIERVSKPTLIMAHNKTLAAQLYEEFKEIFPDNEVHYFVSYYDYYQPEAYIPSSKTYIAKDSKINEHIDHLRHSATSALFDKKDVIIVSSVSCIYGIGSPKEYYEMIIKINVGDNLDRESFLKKLIEIQYERTRVELRRGSFRAIGNYVDILPSNLEDIGLKIKFNDDKIEKIFLIDIYTADIINEIKSSVIFPSSHYVVEKKTTEQAIISIEKELKKQLKYLKKIGKLDEYKRLEERTIRDMELMEIMGFCPGIENYSMHLDQRMPGQPPNTLIDYFPKDFLMIIDESHQTIPQIRGMYEGDRSRKQTLVDHGFRLPSALDNRPLNINEFEDKINQIVYVSATPSKYELEKSNNEIIEQIIRPTGLVDPTIEIMPSKNQVDHLFSEINKTIKDGNKVLVTTLTKRMAEELTEFYKEKDLRVEYMHSEIKTLERVEIIKNFRSDKFDVLVGINLLREGLDLPEVSLVAILDADKEGYLRSESSLIQIFGRAARNVQGRVIMYADQITKSMQSAISESNRRRNIQLKFNKDNKIKPKSIIKKVDLNMNNIYKIDADSDILLDELKIQPHEIPDKVNKLRAEMKNLSENLKFEQAAMIRDQIKKLKKLELSFISKID
ncbi:MAG: excinuclease ABC subunit UvrB [Thermodesulfobacteriota bacterium]|nr:excinuclease ABC subunit UvrB [Thermodesulfobacteriota bacterium]